jgi:DNA-binding CsgD family transcriptional regulator
MTRIIFYNTLSADAQGTGTYGSTVRYTTLIWDDALPASSLVSAINVGNYRLPLQPQPEPVFAIQYGDMVLVTRTETNHAKVHLTQHERDVLAMLAEGRSLQQIACQLKLKTRTINNYLAQLKEHLEAGTREQVVARAVALGLYHPSLPE